MIRRRGLSSGIVALSFLALLAARDPAAASAQDKIPVLLYHRISTPAHPMPSDDETITLDLFARQMAYLQHAGYQVIGTAELVALMSSGAELPRHAAVIHFDDGRRSVLDALPVLQRYGFKATFWIIVGRVGDTDYLDWKDIAALAGDAHYEIYSHTMTHSWHGRGDLLSWAEGHVPGKGMADVNVELAESKRILESRLGRSIPYLAWPFGAYNDALIEAAKRAGYQALFTVDWGLNERGGDLLRIHRSFVSGNCSMAVFAQILSDGRSRSCPPISGQAAAQAADGVAGAWSLSPPHN